MLRRFAVFLSFFQSVLFLAHFFVYETLRVALSPLNPSTSKTLAVALAILSISFLSTSLVGFRNHGPLVRLTYTIAAIWLGTFSFVFYAAIGWWLVAAFALLAKFSFVTQTFGILLFSTALAISLCALINAQWLRVQRVRVTLAGLPASWRGRTVALVSDLHLGHIRNSGFASRVVRRINAEKPDLVILAGDLFDGTAVDAERATSPFKYLRAPFGSYFSEGNHEEFNDPQYFLEAIAKSGVRILDRQKVELDGLQLLGIRYLDATQNEHLASLFTSLNIDRTKASILICHAPDRPAIAEQAGISLQLSGHTHGGQFIPYSWVATRIYRQFVHGLSRIGNLQVYTSYGAGTWGPPLRLGTYPEITILGLQ